MKKKSIKSRILFLAIASVFVMTTLFTGCQRNKEKDSTTVSTSAPTTVFTQTTGTVTVSGSTSVQPLAQNLAHIFTDKYTNINVDVQGGGSSNGVRAAIDGTSDIGMSSRNLKQEEKDSGVTEHVIALDGIAVIVNKASSVKSLTIDQVKKIYTGEIKNWKDVGGPDKQIIVVSRESGSGTRGAFEEILGFKDLIADALIGNGTGAIKAHVVDKLNAIGYISLGALDDSIAGVKINGANATVDNIKAGTYPISRPFIMITKGDLSDAVKAFFDFIMSDEGQQIVTNDGFIDVK